jgi:hypothetical protein
MNALHPPFVARLANAFYLLLSHSPLSSERTLKFLLSNHVWGNFNGTPKYVYGLFGMVREMLYYPCAPVMLFGISRFCAKTAN